MKCTNNNSKIRLLCIICVAAVFMSGCNSNKALSLENKYNAYSSKLTTFAGSDNSNDFFAKNLCVTDKSNARTDEVESKVAEAAGVFNIDNKEVLYKQNIFEKMYPASTTKILTAYIICENANLDETVTISENAIKQTSDSSVCGLKAGDKLTVRDLLYGLMLASGNDAAIALAEYYSGSVDEFASIMNEVAFDIGATNSHFVNPNGLPNEEHYTSVYDMYLIMQKAVENNDFLTIISTRSYAANYTDQTGNIVSKNWNNTNQYLSGVHKAPDGITVIGGKTGTTNAAGYCLVLFSTNDAGQRIISIVFKADCRSNLYYLMNQILALQ